MSESESESESVSVFEFVFEGGERGRWRVGTKLWRRLVDDEDVPRFDHHRLDAFLVARQALTGGEAIAQRIPRGYANLADQLRRALLSCFLGIAEASSRSGTDRLSRFRCARGEASEAAAALEAVQLLHLAPDPQTEEVLALLDRLCAMLTRLARLTNRSPNT